MKHPFISKTQKAAIAVRIPVALMQYILENFHPINRPLNKGRAVQLAGDIQNNRWNNDNANWIRFDINGNLIDGQHRFTMHVKAGKDLVANVHWGLSTNAILSIDDNLPRALYQNLLIQRGLETGVKPTKAECAYERLRLQTAARMLRNGKNQGHFSSREILEFAELNAASIKFAMNQAPCPVLRPGFVSAIAYVHLHNPSVAASVKNTVSSDGEGLQPSPALALRNFLSRPSGGGTQPVYDFNNTVYVCNAVANRNPVAVKLGDRKDLPRLMV